MEVISKMLPGDSGTKFVLIKILKEIFVTSKYCVQILYALQVSVIFQFLKFLPIVFIKIAKIIDKEYMYIVTAR